MEPMASGSHTRAAGSAPPKRGRHLLTFGTIRWLVRSSWHVFRTMLSAVMATPPVVRVVLGIAIILLVWLTGNWVYHAIHKPSEVFFPLDGTLTKSPRETWRQYGPLFREHSTPVMTPELLAALAQVEGAGNPVARTYWRWRVTSNPLEMYQPASSAVGMYQITDGTFEEAKRYCIHDHVVVTEGVWHDRHSCWFNSLYFRVLPSHAIELTSALLDREVANTIERRRLVATLQQKQDLAAMIHLCGAGAGHIYAARGFRLLPRQKCGNHDVGAYLTQVRAMKRQFARLAVIDSPSPVLRSR